jgi:hypothetical protein
MLTSPLSGSGTVRRVRDAVSPGLWVVGILSAVLVVALTVAAIWTGFWGLGTPRDRAAANQALQVVAGLLGGRFRTGMTIRGTGGQPSTGPSRVSWAGWATCSTRSS